MLDVLYYGLLAFFVAHELDAVKRHEWRILPLTSFLSERVGAQTFIWLHVPIFLAIFWFGEGLAANGVRIGLSIFAMVHVGLHWLFRRHPANEFNDLSSWTLIVITGVLGAAYFAAALA